MVSNKEIKQIDDDDIEDDESDADVESDEASEAEDEAEINETYNITKKDKHLAVASLLAFKLKQEAKLKSKLRPHFEQVGKQVKKSYANNGKLPSFKSHRDAVKSIINDHYIDTATKTSSTLRDNFQPVKNDAKLQALIDTQIESDADDRSDFAADSIVDTTESNFKDYIKETIATAAIAGILLSKDDIAGDISDKFDDTTDGRLDLIAQMETGIAADDGKADEMDALENTDAEFEDGTTLSDYKRTKTWVAVMDDHTRPEHAEADGQEVDYDEPFEVGGEQMMEPMDDSLGASDWNIYGCRCQSVESLE